MKDFTQKLFALTAFLLIGMTAFSQDPFFTEDFDGALPADWKAIKIAGDNTPSSNWVWSSTGPAGGFAIGAIQSTTAANGFMLFDSDLNCSGNQNVWLQSPKLDLSDKDNVVLQFQTHYRRFNDRTWVEVSTDSVNWTPIEIFTGFTNNMYAHGATTNPENPVTLTVNLTDFAANEPTVWFAFHFLADPTTVLSGSDIGCGYSWQIDDVQLLDFDPTPANNLSMGTAFYTPASFAQPVSQIAIDTFVFSAGVSNIGVNLLTNVVFKATVTDAAGAVLYQDSTILAEGLAVGGPDSTIQIGSTWAPEVEVGDYEITYEVYSLDAEDDDASDNTITVPWVVTEDLWSKENSPNLITRPGGDPADWVVANIYTTSPNLVDDFEFIEATFYSGVGSTGGNLAGKQVEISLLEVVEDVVAPGWSGFDNTLDYISNPGLNLRSINFHEYTTAGNQGFESTTLIDFDDDEPGVPLVPGARYFLCAGYSGDFRGMTNGFSTEIDYQRVFSTVIYIADDQWYNVGFGSEYAAALRLKIQLANVNDASERTLSDNVLSYFPNPATDKLNVQLKFEKPEVANVTLADMNGRVILIDEMTGVTEASRQYDVSKLPAGTYLVRVATKEGTKTKKFVVVR